ncbi:MAG: hypothetical protein DIU67_008130, partial [Actinomycetes bacterium]
SSPSRTSTFPIPRDGAHAITGTLLSIANHRYEVRARLNEFVAPGASVTVTVTSVAGLLLVCAPITWS